MDRFELFRLVILGIGWPILIAGSIRLAWQARNFYHEVDRSSFGRLVSVLVAGILVTMYALGVTATAFMWLNPRQGVPIIVPIFAGWLMLMLLVATSLGRWTDEVAAVGAVHAQLDEANRARVDLVNRASHELSTPLTPLMIQLALLQDPELGPLTAQQKRSIDIMGRNLGRLTAIVREMMDASRLQRGHLELLREDVDLSETLQEVFDAYRPQGAERHLQYEADIEPGLHVEADPVRFAQVAQNMLSNAIQFTPVGGKVRLVARRNAERAEVVVEDTGVGFSVQDAGRLFEPFAEIASRPERRSSIGLGLYIARSIVEAHGGKVWARSDGVGRGATFGFSVPLMPSRPTTSEPAPAAAATQRHAA